MKNSHNWIFHPNELTGTWNAVRRDDYHLLFNDVKNPKVLTTRHPEHLRELIDKTDGDIKEINKLLKSK